MSNDRGGNRDKTRVSPQSKSIDLVAVRKINPNGFPYSETLENDNESPIKSQTENHYFLNRSMTTSLYHVAISLPHIEQSNLNTFNSHSKILTLTILSRIQILLKILISIIYPIASPISLIIFLSDFIGYISIRYLRQCLLLLYIILLTVTIIIRIIVSILLGLNFSSLSSTIQALEIITIFLVLYDGLQIATLLKLYNILTTLDINTKKTIQTRISARYLPP